MDQITLATRQSELALCQAYIVKNLLMAKYPSMDFAIKGMTTTGDNSLGEPLYKIGGKALFMKELEIAMKNNQAELAVHSLKDVPYQMPEGFILGAFLARTNPQDALVSNHYNSIDALPAGAIVGTSSLRRKAQLLAYRQDLQIKDLRGNVQTRLAKLDCGNYDAIVLAAAGLIRLKLEKRIADLIPIEICLPAVGQGIIVVEHLQHNKRLSQLLSAINDPISYRCAIAERSFSEALEGGCHMPIAAYAKIIANGSIHLSAMVAKRDGSKTLCREIIGKTPEKIGAELAKQMIAEGASAILNG